MLAFHKDDSPNLSTGNSPKMTLVSPQLSQIRISSPAERFTIQSNENFNKTYYTRPKSSVLSPSAVSYHGKHMLKQKKQIDKKSQELQLSEITNDLSVSGLGWSSKTPLAQHRRIKNNNSRQSPVLKDQTMRQSLNLTIQNRPLLPIDKKLGIKLNMRSSTKIN